MYSRYLLRLFFLSVIVFISVFTSAQVSNLPKVWMTYYDGRNLQQDFEDMRAHGVDAVEVGIWGIEGNDHAKKILKTARETGLKLIIGVPEVCEQAYNFEKKPERAIMMGGAYQGKAIDRFRFSFTPEKHSITIESPVYDSINCYGNIGRYFMGLTPVKAEVIVKQADFDGKQHLKIVDAQISPQKENFWNMKFDLTGVEGDLDNVVLAVYWFSEGTREYWIFGDAVSMYSKGFKVQLKKEVKAVVDAWKDANDGVFPNEIVALRYGDECFHISGHLNSDDCSYPMWDFSESAIQQFQKTTDLIYPRGVGWTDMFGHEAYAQWMYNFHEAAANSVKIVNETLKEEGINNLPVFRNTTRMNIFDVMNDWDASGQELLAKELDIIHYDPYPVNDKGYDKSVIPTDMSYAEGLARRLKKPVIPWMQAHVYGHLQLPEPEHISKMVQQHKQFGVDGIMWLGYGYKNSGNTFPEKNPDSWEQAKKEHQAFKNTSIKKNKADFAVIRPYTSRSIRTINRLSDDLFLTDYLTKSLVSKNDFYYDVYEPINCSSLESADFSGYNFVLATPGVVNHSTLQPFANTRKPCLLVVCSSFFENLNTSETGIQFLKNLPDTRRISDNKNYLFNVNRKFAINNQAKILYENENFAIVWKMKNLIFVGYVPENNTQKFAELLLEILESN